MRMPQHIHTCSAFFHLDMCRSAYPCVSCTCFSGSFLLLCPALVRVRAHVCVCVCVCVPGGLPSVFWRGSGLPASVCRLPAVFPPAAGGLPAGCWRLPPAAGGFPAGCRRWFCRLPAASAGCRRSFRRLPAVVLPAAGGLCWPLSCPRCRVSRALRLPRRPSLCCPAASGAPGSGSPFRLSGLRFLCFPALRL